MGKEIGKQKVKSKCRYVNRKQKTKQNCVLHKRANSLPEDDERTRKVRSVKSDTDTNTASK